MPNDMTIQINGDSVAELYRMVQWWCHDQSNTFCYIKEAIEKRYPELAELNRLEFDFDSGKARLVERPHSERIDRLKRLHATALGLYMAQRILGRDADVQLKRVKRLQAELERHGINS